MEQNFVITELSKHGKLLRSSLWDASEPIGLGHPFRYVLEKTESGIRFRNLRTKTARELTNEAPFVIDEGSLKLRIYPAHRKDLKLAWTSSIQSTQPTDDSRENETFKKAFFATAGALVVFLGVAFVMPKSKAPEELIPAQYAKIIMSPPASSGQKASASRAEDQKIARSGSVVNAFKTEVVQKSTHRLLTGGLLAAISKSNLLTDKRISGSVKSMFKSSPTTQLAALAPAAGAPQNTSIGVIGGSKGEAGASGVGYGQGQQLAISGQGKSFVKLENLDARVEEGLTKDEVGQVIHSHIAEIRYCYEAAMLRKPDVQGKLVLDFSISGKAQPGVVKTAEVNSSSLDDYSLDQCILSRLMKWKFPKPKGGVDVAVSYPFILKSLGK